MNPVLTPCARPGCWRLFPRLYGSDAQHCSDDCRQVADHAAAVERARRAQSNAAFQVWLTEQRSARAQGAPR